MTVYHVSRGIVYRLGRDPEGTGLGDDDDLSRYYHRKEAAVESVLVEVREAIDRELKLFEGIRPDVIGVPLKIWGGLEDTVPTGRIGVPSITREEIRVTRDNMIHCLNGIGGYCLETKTPVKFWSRLPVLPDNLQYLYEEDVPHVLPDNLQYLHEEDV